ncbi:MAG: FliA/WhiG family RNA polymerase sigma factor [Anaerovibrio sp.]|uniref:sigma-70 family RNA polymerase sigma factor n=1 Tax=Anaerovibrio sp. TaxID=1872532 RepID=UPI0025DA5900|nr:FliA/WhiG family RNA polymerase sigma factor [Anaerovibrio sp.]MCR5176736.1 FliA/WhiG family RNA polymerase sigma factor [Anaerovibrio sp.]
MLYSCNRDLEVRNKLVEHYLPLVNAIAGRLAISLPSHIDTDDLKVSGYFGLMDAIDRYDYNRGNKFETYAGIRISGAMKDDLRSRDWISVSLRQKIKRYESAIIALEGNLGRTPTDDELAQELELSLEQLYALEQQVSASTIIPLGEYIKSETTAAVVSDPTKSLEAIELKETLAKAIDQLSEKERLVVSLYYHEELTMKEISRVLHLSEARICQLHTKAVFKLRGFLANEINEV